MTLKEPITWNPLLNDFWFQTKMLWLQPQLPWRNSLKKTHLFRVERQLLHGHRDACSKWTHICNILQWLSECWLANIQQQSASRRNRKTVAMADHEIIMRSSWDHHEIISLLYLVLLREQNKTVARLAKDRTLHCPLLRHQSSKGFRALLLSWGIFQIHSAPSVYVHVQSLRWQIWSVLKQNLYIIIIYYYKICCNCWILTALVERCGKYHRFSDHCTDSCNPAQVRELIKMSQPHLVYWTHRKYKIGLLSWRFACSVLFWHHIIYV